jgi:hypothetical protein
MLKKTLILAASAVVALGLSASANALEKTGVLERLDTNKDGFVDKAEYLAKTEQRFAKIDTNKDGKLSKEEYKASRDARKARKAATSPKTAPDATKPATEGTKLEPEKVLN